MPPELDDKTDLASSDQVENDVTDAGSAPDGAADPSPANDEPKDLLSVVRDVIKPEEAASSADGEKAEEPAPEGTAEAEAKEPDDTDYSDVPFHKHPRFQQLLAKSKEFEADAGRYRSVETFLRTNHLSADEAADGLNIMALAKTDPAKALEQIKPFVQKLLIAAGEVLPEDLRGQVQSGAMPADAAREVSRSRALLAQREELARRQELDRQAEQHAQQGQALHSAATDWLRDRDQKDPAFQSKYPLMEREVAFLQRTEGRPNTPEGVRDQLKRAYDAVNQQARVVVPSAPKPAVRPITGGAAPSNQAPQPKTMLDAIRAARAAQ